MRVNDMSTGKAVLHVVAAAALALTILVAIWAGYRTLSVWSRELAGKAALAEAEWSKKIAIEEARAELDSAKHLADAEILRAKGVAEANKIIGESLQGNEAYLRYLWVQGLRDGSSEVIYVPTEANLPILEATRLSGGK